MFFRDFFRSDFNLIAGNTDDNRFLIAILEHWRAVAHNKASFMSPNFFWPQRHVLGYSEAFFLPALPYSFFRSVGLDDYLSLEMTLFVLKAIGFFGMLWLLRKSLMLSRPVALVGAALFTLSNVYYISVGHAQLMTVVFIPVFVSLVLSYWSAHTSGSAVRAAGYISAAAVLLALMLFTSFYIGWYTIFAGGTILLTWLLGHTLTVRTLEPVAEWIRAMQARQRTVALGLGVFALALTPVLITYLPALRQTGGRSFSETLQYSAEPVDVINVGLFNCTWGKTFASTFRQLDLRFAYQEKEVGWPPLILLLFAGATLASSVRLVRPATQSDEAQHLRLSLMALLGVAAILLWAMSVKIGRYSLWWLAFHFVPGATAMRVPARISFVVNILVVITAAMALEQIEARIGGRGKHLLIALCGIILLGEQLNTRPSHEIHRDEENALMATIKPASKNCKSFLVTSPASSHRLPAAQQIDAMLVARALNIPTLNGYSGWSPPGWEFYVYEHDYLTQARRWARSKRIESGLCGCDLTTGAWSYLGPHP